jgi:5-methylthioadenosine/S-adenosylhomocysteine deaminase
MDHLTGSLEAGKRADLIVLDLDPHAQRPGVRARRRGHLRADRVRGEVHRRRGRDVQRPLADARPAPAHAGRGGAAPAARAGGADRRVPQGREISVLQKLVAIGGAVEQESFEVQVKARIASAEQVLRVLNSDVLTVIRASHYRQHDTYWSFDDPDQGRCATVRTSSSTRAAPSPAPAAA